MNIRRSLLAILLSCAVVLSFVPTMVFAEPNTEDRGEPKEFTVERDGGFSQDPEWGTDEGGSEPYLRWKEPAINGDDAIRVTYENDEEIVYYLDEDTGKFVTKEGVESDIIEIFTHWENEQTYDSPFTPESYQTLVFSASFDMGEGYSELISSADVYLCAEKDNNLGSNDENGNAESGNLPDKAAEQKAAEIAKAKALATASNINKATVTAADIRKASNLGATTVTLGPKVKKLTKKAFKGTNIKTLVVKTKKLKKANVKKALTGSKVTKIKVNVGKKKTNKRYVKKYKKIFTKGNAGKKVKVVVK